MRAAAFAIALFSGSFALAAPKAKPLPKAVPEVVILDGKEAFLKALSDAGQGGAPVVVHFWATWCPPCVKELPTIAKTLAKARRLGARDVVISVDAAKDRSGKVTRMLAKSGLTGRSYLLENLEFDVVASVLDPEWSGGLPATFVLKNGEPEKAWYGPVKDTAELLAEVAPQPAPARVP